VGFSFLEIIKSIDIFIDESIYYNLMDKLKELLQKSKPTTKIVEQKKVIEEQNKKFK
jgi:hypothetical protein